MRPSAPVTASDGPPPALSTLLGDGTAGLLAELLHLPAGHLRGLRAELALYRPGRRLTVRYRAELQANGAASRSPVTVAARAVAGDEPRLEAWLYPNDPELPGLPFVSDGRLVRNILDSLGAPSGAVSLRRHTYRPGKRAVLEARCAGRRMFLKVIPPRRTAAMRDAHASLADLPEAPDFYGASAGMGLLLLEARPGVELSERLRGADGWLPPADVLLELLGRLRAPEGDRGPASGVRGHAQTHVEQLSALLPRARGRLAEIAARLGTDVPEPLVPVHGDLHPGQLLLGEDSITGLVDLDGVRLGHRSDDLATFLGYVSVAGAAGRGRAAGYERELVRAFDRIVDPVDLRRRVAAAVLGRATAPFRQLRPDWRNDSLARIALAERWLDLADRGS